jgi:hypothetical protein
MQQVLMSGAKCDVIKDQLSVADGWRQRQPTLRGATQPVWDRTRKILSCGVAQSRN